jgi:hypothetical protein
MAKLERKRPFEDLMLRWEDNIERNFKDTQLEVVGWIHVAWDRNGLWALIHTVINIHFS